MTSVQAFNDMLANFIDQLRHTFPEDEGIELFSEKFDTLKSLNVKKPLEFFMTALAPHTDLIMSKDPALFDRASLDASLDLGKLWRDEGLTGQTREAIWQHIQTLFMIGTTLQYMPADMLQNIEKVARECSARVENGEKVDFASVASNMVASMGLFDNKPNELEPRKEKKGRRSK